MAIWTDSQINNWAQEAENAICLKLNLIIDRVGLATTTGQSIFNLPSYVNSIRNMTFQGFKIDPSSFLEVTSSLSSLGRVISSSRPLNYVYNGFGPNTVKLYPSVGINTSVPSGDLFNSANISTGLVIEVYRSPDFTVNTSSTIQQLRIPAWFRRIIIKSYVLMRALAQEGPGQDLAGSRYFAEEYAEMLLTLKQVNNTTFLSKINILGDAVNPQLRRNARPQLPPNYPRSY